MKLRTRSKPRRRGLWAIALGLLAAMALVAPSAASAASASLAQAASQTLGPGAGRSVAASSPSATSQSQSTGNQTKIVPGDAAPGDLFGYSLALSSDGSTAVIGAPRHNGTNGAAYVFVRGEDNRGWSLQKELVASDGAPADGFGSAVAVSNNGHEVLVGAPNKNGNGAAYVFVRSAGKWKQQAELVPADLVGGDQFGASVALISDGQKALIGAWGSDAAYVFGASKGVWTQQQKLTASGGTPGDGFGYSVSFSRDGSIALVGAPFQKGATGASYVFTGTGYAQQAKLTASDASSGDEYGFAVALSTDGKVALIGAPGHPGGSSQGEAYVDTGSGTTWAEQQKLTASDGTSGDGFGSSVALAFNGHAALIGAPGWPGGGQQGVAYVFAAGQQLNAFKQLAELKAKDGAPGDSFGFSVAVASEAPVALVGAPGKNSQQGAAYAFAANGDGGGDHGDGGDG